MSKVTPKTGVTLDKVQQTISEYTIRLELNMIMCCSYIVFANPDMKLRIQSIIMKIFMQLMKICPKSPQFTVPKVWQAHKHTHTNTHMTMQL